MFRSSGIGGLHSWNWRSPALDSLEWPDLRAAASELDQVTRDREELAPDYRDPVARPSDEKPVVQLKPTTTTTTTAKPFNAALPGGVVDVDAGGFGAFPTGGGFSSFPGLQSNFGFGFNNRPGGLFGLGGFFGSSVGELQPWWKG